MARRPVYGVTFMSDGVRRGQPQPQPQLGHWDTVTCLHLVKKRYEELLIGYNHLPTRHPRMMKAHKEFLPWDELQSKLNVLNDALDVNNVPLIRTLLKDLVPGYQPEGAVVDWVWMENEKLA